MAVVAGEGVAQAGGELGEEAEGGEVVGGDAFWGVIGEEDQGAAFEVGGEGLVEAGGGVEGGLWDWS